MLMFSKWRHLRFYSRNYPFSPLQFQLIEWGGREWRAEIVFREWPGDAVTCRSELIERHFYWKVPSLQAACPGWLLWEPCFNSLLWKSCWNPSLWLRESPSLTHLQSAMGLVGFVSGRWGLVRGTTEDKDKGWDRQRDPLPTLASWSVFTSSPGVSRSALFFHHGEAFQAGLPPPKASWFPSLKWGKRGVRSRF